MQPLPIVRMAVLRWVTLLLVLVALMVAVGGVTRLSESGLSIVEWKLVSGTLPPMSDAEWAKEFDAYKTSPQFLKVNRNFDVTDFKKIFWLEYVHRLLGRIIGMVAILPLLYFAARHALPAPLLKRMVFISILIGAQGTVGWIMVASGLRDEPRVEPLKLALHLILAFSVFLLLLQTRWHITGMRETPVNARFAWLARLVFAIILLQIVMGALVAGLRAGLSYTTYPLMDGQFIPDGLHTWMPWWRNHLENVLTVQFQHRMGALITLAASLGLVAYGWRHAPLRWLAVAVCLQFALGVATLLSGVNLWLASAHQLVALLLLSTCWWIVHAYPPQAR